MEFVFASGNKSKALEFKKLFIEDNHEIISVRYNDENSYLDIPEPGETLYQNAHIKAKAYFDFLKCPVFSDDSGLFIEDLPNELGVHSAYFGGEQLNDEERCHLVLERMKTVKAREAYFASVLCFYISDREFYFFEGRLKGKIATEMRGKAGFGYDPLFLPTLLNNQSLAEVPDWKAAHSHRVQAANLAKKFFKEKSWKTN